MSVIRISSPGLPVRGRCAVTSSPGTSTRVVIPGRCSVPVIQVADLTPGGHRRPLSPHGAGDYGRERGPRVPPLDRAPRRGARVPARLSCCRKPLVGAGRPAEGATHHGDRDSTHDITLPREVQGRVHCSVRLRSYVTRWSSSSTSERSAMLTVLQAIADQSCGSGQGRVPVGIKQNHVMYHF